MSRGHRYASTPAEPPTTQAERTARRAAFRDAFARSAPAYTPNSDQRTTSYRSSRGPADDWPIPLTPCK